MSAARSNTNPAIDARVAMVNGNFILPDETLQAMKRIREITAKAALEIKKTMYSGVKYDTGRSIAALDFLQITKNTACDALILPHYDPTTEIESKTE